MDIDSRIRRHQQRSAKSDVVLDWDLLNPVAHVEEPIGRGPIVERLLDHLDPIFEGGLPPHGYVWGPSGSGKSVVLTALQSRLATSTIQPGPGIQTSTRAQAVELPRVVYFDVRNADSEFKIYQRLLEGIQGTTPPQQGVSTSELRSRLQDHLSTGVGSVIVVDHVDEQDRSPPETLSMIESIGAPVSVIFAGQTPLSDVDDSWDVVEIEVPGYGQSVLIDVLMTRASAGLAQNVFTYEDARRIAAWAGGNAHDALAALFGAAVLAERADASTIREQDITGGIDGVPRDGCSLGYVCSLAPNRQAVLRAFLDLSEPDRSTITATTAAIADSSRVELSAGTVKRYLYELAEDGVFERIQVEGASGNGRPPSRLEPQFPTLAFETIYDFQQETK